MTRPRRDRLQARRQAGSPYAPLFVDVSAGPFSRGQLSAAFSPEQLAAGLSPEQLATRPRVAPSMGPEPMSRGQAAPTPSARIRSPNAKKAPPPALDVRHARSRERPIERVRSRAGDSRLYWIRGRSRTAAEACLARASGSSAPNTGPGQAGDPVPIDLRVGMSAPFGEELAWKANAGRPVAPRPPPQSL